MSINAINNPFSSGYGINPYAMRKAVEEAPDLNQENLNSDAKNLADVLSNASIPTMPSLTPVDNQWEGEMEMGGQDKKGGVYNPNLQSLAALVEKTARSLGIEGKVTFNTLMEHRDSMVDDFQSRVQKGLSELGVDKDADFRITLDVEGNIKVSSNHKDKAKIEKFFRENPDLSKQYQEIDALNQVEEMRKNQGYSLESAYQSSQLLSYGSAFYNQQSAMAMVGSGSLASFLTGGINRTV